MLLPMLDKLLLVVSLALVLALLCLLEVLRYVIDSLDGQWDSLANLDRHRFAICSSKVSVDASSDFTRWL